jgi:hypothetical protein
MILPALRETFEETLAAVDTGADLLVSHPITFAARLVAESRGIPWAARPAGDRSHLLPASIYPGPRRRRAGPAARRPGILSMGIRSRGHEDGVRAACDALEALLPNVHGTMP